MAERSFIDLLITGGGVVGLLGGVAAIAKVFFNRKSEAEANKIQAVGNTPALMDTLLNQYQVLTDKVDQANAAVVEARKECDEDRLKLRDAAVSIGKQEVSITRLTMHNEAQVVKIERQDIRIVKLTERIQNVEKL